MASKFNRNSYIEDAINECLANRVASFDVLQDIVTLFESELCDVEQVTLSRLIESEIVTAKTLLDSYYKQDAHYALERYYIYSSEEYKKAFKKFANLSDSKMRMINLNNLFLELQAYSDDYFYFDESQYFVLHETNEYNLIDYI